ncbi:MAG: hypothetical protein ACYC7A_21460 [Thermoanaerobaculia bacterium]
MTDTPNRKTPPPDDAPPFGRSWTPLYAFVIGTLVALIIAFTIFTMAFE